MERLRFGISSILGDLHVLVRAQRGKPSMDVPATLEYLRQFVETVDQEVYGSYEEEARERLRGRDENDWTILALALSLAAAVWTEDADFLGTGVAVWTTNRIEIFLRSQNTSEEG
jgi:hypothetical protein